MSPSYIKIYDIVCYSTCLGKIDHVITNESHLLFGLMCFETLSIA